MTTTPDNRPLLVGQAPGPRTDPREPLSGRCGARLAALCGMEPGEFMAAFERINLIDRHPGAAAKGDLFPAGPARRAAVKMLVGGKMSGRKVVMLGGNVSRAFCVDGCTPLVWFWTGAVHFAICPHPSGVNRWWNEPRNVRAARRFWRGLARGAGR